MKKGIIIALLYYSIGALLTVLSYFLFDNNYGHAPSVYMLVAASTYFGGIFWIIGLIFTFLFGKATEKHQYIMLTHAIVLSVLFLLIYLSFK